MRNRNLIPQRLAASHFSNWTKNEIEQFLWDAGVLTKAGIHGFRKAATDAFLVEGYRLATISREIEPFGQFHKLSLYVMGDRPRLNPQEMNRLARKTMQEIGCPVKADECQVDISGRRAVVSVALPRWAWPRL